MITEHRWVCEGTQKESPNYGVLGFERRKIWPASRVMRARAISGPR